MKLHLPPPLSGFLWVRHPQKSWISKIIIVKSKPGVSGKYRKGGGRSEALIGSKKRLEGVELLTF